MQFSNKYMNDVLNPLSASVALTQKPVNGSLFKVDNKDMRTIQELNGYFIYKRYTLKLAHDISS